MVRHKPFLLAISGIRKVYSTFPDSSLHNSFNAACSNGLIFTIGQESTTYELVTGFVGSILCSSTSTTYHLPIICNEMFKIKKIERYERVEHAKRWIDKESFLVRYLSANMIFR